MRVKTEARREALLAAAKAVFEEVGYEQATMSDIAARVGGSKATLYRYFDSKESLLMELVNRSARDHSGEVVGLFRHRDGSVTSSLSAEATEVLNLLDPDEDVNVTLQKFGERYLKNFHTPQKLAAKRMMYAAAANNPELGRLFYENGPGMGMKLLERYFESLMKAGKIRQANPRVVAAHFRALYESEVDERGMLHIQTELSNEEIVGVVERAVDAFMRAYGLTQV